MNSFNWPDGEAGLMDEAAFRERWADFHGNAATILLPDFSEKSVG